MDDSDLYAALWAIVEQTPGAESTWFGDPSQVTQDSYPAVVLSPTSWTETGDVDPDDPVRSLTFELRILVAGKGGIEQFTTAAEILADLLGTIRGNTLGGLAIGPRTRITSGRVERKYPAEPPAHRGAAPALDRRCRPGDRVAGRPGRPPSPLSSPRPPRSRRSRFE